MLIIWLSVSTSHREWLSTGFARPVDFFYKGERIMKYVCELCGTIYDEAVGDPGRKIPAGTAFGELPADYTCPVCGSEKEAFTQSESGTSQASGNADRYHSQR